MTPPKRLVTGYLVVNAHGEMRVVKKQPRASATEVVVKLNLTLPTPPKLAAEIDIDLPDPPDANVEAMVEGWGEVTEEEDN